MKRAIVEELRPGYFRIVLNTTVVRWKGTHEAVMQALRSMGYTLITVRP
jgi:hypothetical protein